MPRNSILTELGVWLQSNKRSRMKVFINFLTIFINTVYDDLFNYINNPDRVLEIGTEVVDGNSYTYENYKWLIGQVEYNNTSNPITLNIISTQEGYKRKDVSYFLSDGTIGLKRGTETNGEVVETPSIPVGSLFFKYYDIEGSTINPGDEPVLGVNYKVKVESAFTPIDNTSVNLIIPINPSGSNYYIIGSDSVTNIRGFSKSLLILSRTSEWPYEGKDFYIKNKSSTEKNLIQNYTPADIPLILKGGNMVLKPGEVISFKFFEDTMRILYITGNEADLSTKADLVGGKVPESQLPSYVDDVLEFADLASFPVTGETGKIYLALDTNKTYRWSGSAYIQLSAGVDFPSDDKIYGVKNGLPAEVSDELYRSWFSYMANNGGSWLVLNTGNPLTVSGTSTVVPRSGTTIYGSIIMNNCVSATPNGSNAGIKNNNASDGVYLEGVDAYFVWGNNDSNNQCCTAVGLYSLLSALPNLDPSNFTAQTVMVGNDVGDTNLSFYVNRTGAPASFIKVPTNSSFPANSTADAYLLRIQINKTLVEANRTAKLTLVNIITGAIFTHSFTGSQIPTQNTNFSVVVNRSNRNTGVATNTRPAKIYVNRKLF